MSYNSSIKYYRVNANNNSIATSNSGGTDGQPTEEIAAPLLGGTLSAFPTTSTINGQVGSTFGVWAPGQYLYWTNSQGAYILLGQIATIDPSGLSLTLTGSPNVSPSPVTGSALSASFSLVTTTESFYIRVKTDKTDVSLPSNSAYIPNIASWRQSNTAGAQNRTDVTMLQQYSSVGTPTSPVASPVNIPFTLQVMNVFTPVSSSTPRSWPNFDDIPDYIWLLARLSGSNAALAGQTMYRITTEEYIQELLVEPNFLNSTLKSAGYLDVSSAGTTNNNGGVGGS